jgi:hypothetical protein
MTSPSHKDEPPTIDHRAHLTRIGLEVGQIAAIVGALVELARKGPGVTSGAAVAAAVVLTVILMRTPRPPLPGDDRSEGDR